LELFEGGTAWVGLNSFSGVSFPLGWVGLYCAAGCLVGGSPPYFFSSRLGWSFFFFSIRFFWGLGLWGRGRYAGLREGLSFFVQGGRFFFFLRVKLPFRLDPPFTMFPPQWSFFSGHHLNIVAGIFSYPLFREIRGRSRNDFRFSTLSLHLIR